jgi:hypothetical protein
MGCIRFFYLKKKTQRDLEDKKAGQRPASGEQKRLLTITGLLGVVLRLDNKLLLLDS